MPANNSSVFDFKNYCSYLKHKLGSEKQRTGQKSKASAFIGCQTAYLSQILSDKADLSLEQGEKMARFLELGPEESHFFLLLLQKDRAGSRELKLYFDKQIEKILTEREKVKSRIEINKDLTELQKNKYYSSWVYLAAHMGLSIPNLQLPRNLSKYLGLDLQRLYEVLNFLVQAGLAIQDGENYKISPTHIHLGNDEDNILKHHSNWRLRALMNLESKKNSPINYAVTYSVSRADAKKIQQNILQMIEENMKIVAPSPEEVLMCNVIDFFEVGSSSNF